MEKTKRMAGWGIVVLLLFPSLSYYINTIIQKGFGMDFSVSPVFYIIIVIFSIYSMRAFLWKQNQSIFLFCLVLLISTIIALVIYDELTKEQIFSSFDDLAYNPFYRCFLFALPIMPLLSMNDDFDSFSRSLLMVSRLTIFAFFLSYYFIITRAISYDYMTFSYHSVFAASYLYARGSRFDKLLIIPTVIFVAIAGARGALVSIIVFYICMKISESKGAVKKILLYSIILTIVLVLIYNSATILAGIGSLMTNFGIKSYLLNNLVSGNFWVSKGRTNLISGVIEGLNRWPLGFGLWGDRYLVGYYCHNLFFEILADFGYLVGSGLIILIIYKLVVYLRWADEKERQILIILVPMGIIQLFFSSSFLYEPCFFAIIYYIFWYHGTQGEPVSYERT